MSTATMEKRETAVNRPERTHGGPTYSPNVDIMENQDELLLVADLPGVTPGDIDIKFEQGELTIHARVPQRQDENVNYLLAEYGIGDYFRKFTVGEDVNAEAIHAEFCNGALKLHLPKLERAKPRKISVQQVS